MSTSISHDRARPRPSALSPIRPLSPPTGHAAGPLFAALSPPTGHAAGPLFAALLLSLAMTLSGCGALLLVGGAGTSAIAFATGELRVTEEAALVDVHEATRKAVETLRYVDVEATLRDDEVRWRATTAGGDPVDIRLISRDQGGTDLRIRIGVFGSEARSRLVLEQIRQSL